MKNILIPILILLFTSSCFESLPEQNEEKKANNLNEVLVQEVIHAGIYTYLKVSGENGESWLAVPKMESKPGDIFYFQGGLPMANFKSKELDRVFPMVLFLEKVYKSPEDVQKITKKSPHAKGNKSKVAKSEVKVKPAQDGITIAELFANIEKHKGQTVKIRGQVTKYNANIMNINWLHIQDGTEHEGKYDIVVTSTAKFKVGDIVTITGKVSLNKDFGHGYFYELIIEDANAEVAMK